MLLPMVSVLFMTIFPVSRTGPSPPTPRKSSNYLREKRQEYLHEGVKYLELNCLQVMPPYFANKGLSGQSYGFPSGHVWMWELDYKESWMPKNWWFKMWCWRRLLRVPWTARRSNQSILKEISPEYSLEGLMLKLKLQYFGHLIRRTESLEKILMMGKIEGRRRRGWHRMR